MPQMVQKGASMELKSEVQSWHIESGESPASKGLRHRKSPQITHRGGKMIWASCFKGALFFVHRLGFPYEILKKSSLD